MPENAEDTLLSKAIAHANRAEELVREGFLNVADVHDSIANTFRSLAHEVRVGKSKNKYRGISELSELPYTMTNELRGAEKEPPPAPVVSNYYNQGGGSRFGVAPDMPDAMARHVPLPGDPGGHLAPTGVAFDERVEADEPRNADHEDAVDGADGDG